MNTYFSILLSIFLFNSSEAITPNGDLNERHQAMYLVNLVRNIDWETDNVLIGVVGESPVIGELETLLKRNPKVGVKSMTEIKEITTCNIVFLPDASNSSFFLAQKEIGDAPVILVVDKKPLVARGAEMGFYMEDDKLKIAMNPKAIEESGIKVSHTLMEKAALN